MVAEPIRVFISYCQQDKAFLEELETHLAALKRIELVASWSQRNISAGSEWKTELKQQLEKADVILLLISADFIASDHCYDMEMHRAIERHYEGTAQVIPVIVRPTDWERMPFGILDVLPVKKALTQWSNRDEAWVNVVQGVCRVVGLPVPNQAVLSGIKPPENIPRSGASKFVGRVRELNWLQEHLQDSSQALISAVSGMGGIGKTELAIQYAKESYKQGKYLGGVCWIRARDQDIAVQILEFARIKLGLTLPENLDLVKQVECCWHQWQLSKGTALVVFDDLVDYQDLEPYLPPSHFKVLVTTRLQNLATVVEPLQLDLLEPDKALELLTSLIGATRIQQENDTAQKLCEWLGYLPLALELVGRYLQRRKDTSLEKMLIRLENKRLEQKALQHRIAGMTTQHESVNAAFELSWQALDESAQLLGCFLSVFASAPIPWKLVEQCRWSDFEEESLEDWRDEQLVQLSLLRRIDNGVYQLHQLIREFFQWKLENTPQKGPARQQYCQIILNEAKQIPKVMTKSEILSIRPLIPHLAEGIQNLIDYFDNSDFPYLFLGVGRFYQEQGDYDQTIRWYEKCLEESSHRLDKKHPERVNLLNNLAQAYYRRGFYDKAEPLYEEALALYVQLYGFEHSLVAGCLNNKAGLLQRKGLYQEAEKLFIKALKIRKSTIKGNSQELGESLNNLALCYHSQRRLNKAEPLYIEALEVGEAVFGRVHYEIATTLENLARLYHDQEKNEKVEALYQEALEIRTQTQGKSHPSRAKCLHNLAVFYAESSNYAKAESLLIEALELTCKNFGENHFESTPDIITLGNIYRIQGRYKEAESSLKKALISSKTSLGDLHPVTISAYGALVEAYFSQRKLRIAEKTAIQALNLAEHGTNRDNLKIEIIDLLNQLSKIYWDENNIESAIFYLNRAVEKASNLPEGTAYERESLLHNLASLSYARGLYQDAENLFQQVLELTRKKFGDDNLSTANAMSKLAATYNAQRKHIKAEKLYRKSLEAKTRFLGDRHVDVASLYNDLAELYTSEKKYNLAEQFYKKALDIVEEELGKTHDLTITVLYNLAGLYKFIGYYSKSEELYLEAIERFKESSEEIHQNMAICMNNLAGLYQRQGAIHKAIPLYEKALALARQKFPKGHPDISTISNNLNSALQDP